MRSRAAFGALACTICLNSSYLFPHNRSYVNYTVHLRRRIPPLVSGLTEDENVTRHEDGGGYDRKLSVHRVRKLSVL